MWNSLLRNLGVSIVGLIVAVVIAETFARFYYDGLVMTGTIMSNDPVLAFRHKRGAEVNLVTSEFTNHFAIDQEYGVRVLDSASAVPTDPRFAVYGDSMAFGYGVEFSQTYSEILNREFGANTILNLGTYSYGPGQEFLLAAELRDSLKPDAEVVLFYAGNDFENFERYFEMIEGSDGEIGFTEANDPSGKFRRAVTNSFLYPAITRLHLYHWVRNVFLQGGATPPPASERFPNFPRDQLPEQEREKVQKLFRLFSAWSNEVGKDSFYVILLPHQQSLVFPDIRIDQLHALLKGNVQVFQFLDYLTEQERGEYPSLFYPIDAHFNRKGHEVLANVLSRILPFNGEVIETAPQSIKPLP